MRRSVTSLPYGQLLPVVREAHWFEWNARIAVHQVYEVCTPMSDAQLLQEEVFHGQESCRAFRLRSAEGLPFVTPPVGICGIQLGFDGCHLRVYAVPEAVMVGGLVAGNTDILEPTAQQFLVAHTGLVGHNSQLQGQPAFNGRVSTLVKNLLEIAVG